MAKQNKNQKPKEELEVQVDNTTENQGTEQVQSIESELQPETQESQEEGATSEQELDSEKIYEANKVLDSEAPESPSNDDTLDSNVSESDASSLEDEPLPKITDADMLVMEDTGMGLARTPLKVMVNAVSPKLISRVRFSNGKTDTVMGHGQGYILLSNQNPYPRTGLCRGEIITCI